MIYLHKILPVFLSPLFVLGLCVMWAVWRRQRWLAVLAILGLWTLATPFVSDRLMRAVEGHSVRLSASSMPQVDAIVVLSGMLTDSPGEAGTVTEWGDADRFFAGLELYAAKRSASLIFTRGKLPWSLSQETEGDVLRRYALQSGVPASAIALTTEVTNTRQEAAAVRSVLKKPPAQVILVTSAFHMARARQVFEREGLRVHAFPVDFKARVRRTTFIDFLPDARALRWADVAIRDWIGQLYYRWASWS